MSSLELKVPPLVVLAVAATVAWLLARVLPDWSLGASFSTPAAVVLFACGVAVALSGVASFRAAKTTVNPLALERAASVVQSGVYRWSRNPMYLGMLLVLAAHVLYLGSGAALAVLPLFIWYMGKFQIAPEERFLAKKFGAEYVEYMSRVRRWL